MSSSRRKILYVCTCFFENGLRDLYIGDLYDSYIIRDFSDYNLEKSSGIHLIDKKIPQKIFESIKTSDIIIAFIESASHHYTETIFEIGVAVALNKPIVIYDSSKSDETESKEVGHKEITKLPLYWSNTILHTFKWAETRESLKKIAKFIDKIKEDFDSDDSQDY